MSGKTILTTERLLLRTWREEDAKAYFQIHQDPKVTEFLAGPFTMKEVNKFIEAMNEHQQKYGYAFWALQLKEREEILGFVGLQVVSFQATFTPATEIGWRLASQYWGHGYATEAAKAALAHGFYQSNLDKIVAFTSPNNLRSQAVMRRLGMKHSPQDDFSHPRLPGDHPLSHCLLYYLEKNEADFF